MILQEPICLALARQDIQLVKEIRCKMQRSYSVEVWRFVFATSIVIYHSYYFFDKMDITRINVGGRFGVEFFFILSGLLLARKAYDLRETQFQWREAANLMLSKLKTIYPYLLVSTAIGILVSFYATGLNGAPIKLLLLIPELLFLSQTGIPTWTPSVVTWYLSSLMICTAIIYPLLRRNYSFFAQYAFPLLSVFLYGHIVNTIGLTKPSAWNGFFKNGLLRGMAGMMLGAFCFYLISQLNKIQLKNWVVRLMQLSEITIILSVLIWFASKKSVRVDTVFVLLTAVALVFAFNSQRIALTKFPKKLANLLGSFSLSLYLAHGIWPRIMLAIFPRSLNLGAKEYLALYFLISIITALIVHFSAKAIIKMTGPQNKRAIEKL